MQASGTRVRGGDIREQVGPGSTLSSHSKDFPFSAVCGPGCPAHRSP